MIKFVVCLTCRLADFIVKDFMSMFVQIVLIYEQFYEPIYYTLLCNVNLIVKLLTENISNCTLYINV